MPGVIDALALYTVTFVIHEGRWLLLERAAHKRIAPGRWTGVGGRIEPDELGALRASALRELHEETGLTADDLEAFTLRRMLLHDRPGGPLTGLLYVTARLARVGPAPALTSDEGALHWTDPGRFPDLDIIETTAATLPLLVADTVRDPEGRERVRMGLASYRGDDLLAPQWRDGSEPP